MDMQASATRCKLHSVIPREESASGIQSGMLAGTSLAIGLCIVWYSVVASITNGNAGDSPTALALVDQRDSVERTGVVQTTRLASSVKAGSILSSKTYRRFNAVTATISVPEMIRKADNLRLAPIFQGLILAPKLTYDVFLSASVDSPVDECGNTLLHLAVRSGNPLYTWCLLQHGADPLRLNDGGQTVLQTVNCAPGQLRSAVLQSVSHHVRWRPGLLAKREDEPARTDSIEMPVSMASANGVSMASANTVTMRTIETNTEGSSNHDSNDQVVESTSLDPHSAGTTAFDSKAVLSLGVTGRM